MTNNTARIVVHPSTRRGYCVERLRKAAQIEDLAARHRFLEEALGKYRAWALNLGTAPHKVSADLAILHNAFFPRPERRRA
jgi:hypothetical protein